MAPDPGPSGEIRQPGTLAEAAAVLLVNFDVSDLSAWADRPREEALAVPPADVIAWIHARWIKAGASRLVDRIESLDGDVPSWTLDALWRVLNGEPCPTVESIDSACARHGSVKRGRGTSCGGDERAKGITAPR